jgi:arylsulfatase A-like enzyme
MTRHFVWLAPLANLSLFCGMGLCFALLTRLWPRLGGWLFLRVICFFAILPALIALSPRIYPQAWAVLAAGIAVWVSPFFERHAAGLRRWLVLSFPGLAGLVVVSAVSVFGGDWLKERREASRPLPPPGSPNVLLIMLDTVRADRLSLYGYGRPTSPVLETLAKRGIRFDEARAPAPWTLPSHASMFTGRLPHELGVKRLSPLRGSFPTLAEYLGSRGYATAGFVANTLYCSYDTGLDRGFTRYGDYVLDGLLPFRTAWLVDRLLHTVSELGMYVGRTFHFGPFRPLQESWFTSLLASERRKDAGFVNGEFMEWIARRTEPARPFFVFLNYYDAHDPYVLPLGAEYRFGIKPRRATEFIFLMEDWPSASLDKLKLRPIYLDLARDSYDNCLSYLDERLGELFLGLQRRGLLDQTLVIVTSDHGEGLGEHYLFGHGESLYSTEIHVPLLILLPSAKRFQGMIQEAVSLCDLPATITDLAGAGSGSPFPGRSLSRFWRDSASGPASVVPDGAVSELPSPPVNSNQGRSPAHRGPLVSFAAEGFVYIRNEGDGAEELFNERDDPAERHNLAHASDSVPVLERMRRRFSEVNTARAPTVPKMLYRVAGQSPASNHSIPHR